MDKEMKVLYSNSSDLINMSKDRFMNLFLIDILVDGKTIPFVFDTGATITVISESIANRRNESYTLTDAYYAVVRSDLPQEHSARSIIKWLKSSQGNEAIIKLDLIPKLS